MPVKRRNGVYHWETMVNKVRYYGCFNGKDGEDIPRSEREAEDMLAAIRLQIRAGVYGRKLNDNFAAFVGQVFLPYTRANHANPRHAEFRSEVLKQYFGKWRLTEITRMMIEGFIKERLQSRTVRKETVGEKRVNKTRSPTTVRKEVALLAQIFNHARQERLVNSNPCDEIGKAVKKKIPALVRRNRFLTVEEEPKLMEQLKDRREHLLPAVRLALWSGMRRGEILRLKRVDPNFSGETVSRTIGGEIWRIPPGWLLIERSKNGRPRIIPMSGKVWEMLYHLCQDATGGEYVFENIRTGSHILDIKRGFTSAVAGAGIMNLTFHDLRHTWSTRAAELGVPEPVRRDILGHSATSVTDGYTHSSHEARERAMELVANYGNYGKITATTFLEAVAV
ncbi:MAG TPA: site-specific integrase [Pyrinomonadaceae bacterium]|jgi:integrase|nr:site-specific integrase [Pyrinomonadaceae bacterium]